MIYRLLIIKMLCWQFITGVAQPTMVSRVIDGDTFVDSSNNRIRLIGIDAPELKDSHGQSAKQVLEMLINTKSVILHGDEFCTDVDKYGRKLRYVYLDGIDINKWMVESGWAYFYPKYKFKYFDDYKIAQLAAESEHNGIWNNDRPAPNDEIDKSLVEVRRTVDKRLALLLLVLMIAVIWLFSALRRSI